MFGRVALMPIAAKLFSKSKVGLSEIENKTVSKTKEAVKYLFSIKRSFSENAEPKDKLNYEHLKSRVKALSYALKSIAIMATFVAFGALLFSNPVSGSVAFTFLSVALVASYRFAMPAGIKAVKIWKATTCKEDFFKTFRRERLHPVSPQDFEQDFKKNYDFDGTGDLDKIPWNQEKPTALIIRAGNDSQQSWSHRKNCLELAKSHNVLECQIDSDQELQTVLKNLSQITKKQVDFLQFSARTSLILAHIKKNGNIHSALNPHLVQGASIVLDSTFLGGDRESGQRLAQSISSMLPQIEVIASPPTGNDGELKITKRSQKNKSMKSTFEISFDNFYPRRFLFNEKGSTTTYKEGRESNKETD